MSGGYWLTTELAILREHYGRGACAVRALLPHRSLVSIRAKAAAERIKGSRKSTLGKTFARLYPQRDDIDQAIREGYIHAKRKGDVTALAARIGRPAWWVQKRAAKLGVTRSNRTRLDAWTAIELGIVERWAIAHLSVVARKLREAGFVRTQTAIAIILKRRRIDRTDPDTWTATQLGPLFGRDPATVADWIERRGLQARRESWGPNGRLFVHRRDLRRWIAANPQYVDVRRVDQHWFWEVMFGAGLPAIPSNVQPIKEAA